MNLRLTARLPFVAFLILVSGCESKQEAVHKGRETVREVVTQPFNTFDSAKDSIKQSTDKQKAALEEAEKELK